MNDIKKQVTPEDISKIFGNSQNKIDFLEKKNNLIEKFIEENKEDNTRKIISFKKSSQKDTFDKLIAENWDYEFDKKIIRELFFEKNKYLDFDEYEKIKNKMILEWKKDFGNDEIAWPFSQGKFDEFVQGVHNRYKIEEFLDDNTSNLVDDEIKRASVKFRRIKLFNTIINDYIEKMIIESNENIIPTSGNKRSVDFYINGIRYDQKISKSPTKEFIKAFGENYIDYARKHPSIVAKYLYEYQDEERFGNENRLFVVFLDKVKFNTDLSTLRKYVSQFDKMEPYKIKFIYNHKKTGNKNYSAESYVILI